MIEYSFCAYQKEKYSSVFYKGKNLKYLVKFSIFTFIKKLY